MTRTDDITRPRYYLVSCAGAPNYGDELITLAWLRYLAKHAPDADVVVDCVRPEQAEKTMAGVHPRARFTETLWMLCLEQASKKIEEIIDVVTSKVDDPRLATGWEAGVDTLTRSDVVHLVGGGLLNSLYPWAIGLVAGVIAATRTRGARSAVTGQGICPAEPDLLSPLRELMSHLTVADVRDDESARLLALSGVTVSADDVFLDVGRPLFRVDDDSPEVMVCAQSGLTPKLAGSTDAPEVSAWLLGTLRSWGITGVEAGFVECFPGLDGEVHDLLARRMPGIRYYPLDSVLRTGLPVRPGQTWVSTRFHPHLVAATAGLGGLAVSVRPDYYDVKHTSLISRGSGWRLAHTSGYPDRPTGSGFLPSQVAEFTEAKAAIARAVYGR